MQARLSKAAAVTATVVMLSVGSISLGTAGVGQFGFQNTLAGVGQFGNQITQSPNQAAPHKQSLGPKNLLKATPVLLTLLLNAVKVLG
jgi:hypothetical protein